MKYKNETGRSMVEMLGVLAIIGVLSIGGIAGYTYAMDKRKANDIVNEVNKRYVVGSSQVVLGRPLNLSEFPTTVDGYTIGAMDADSVAITEFGIQVSGVPEGVCNRLLDMTDNWKDLLEYAPATCGETNTMQFVFEGDTGAVDPACEGVTCDTGLTCFYGQCKCSDGNLKCGNVCCAEGTYCAQGSDSSIYSCVAPTNSDCTKNEDCKDSEGNVDTSKYCKFNGGSCSGPTYGTCTDKGSLTSYTLKLPAGDLTVYKGGSMNWWSASNLCKAHGKQMVMMVDLGISTNGQAYCGFDSDGDPITYSETPCICNEGADSDCSATDAVTRTLGTGYVWFADKCNTCTRNSLDIEHSFLSCDDYDTGNSALCR